MAENIDPDKPSVYNNFQTTSQEIAAFLAKIQEEPDDDTNRLVFADYLDEKFPELAGVSALYRGGAREWMEKFVEGETTCTNYGEACDADYAWYRAERDGVPESERPPPVDYVYVPVTVEDMLEAGRAFVQSDGAEWFTQTGAEGLRNKMYDDNNLETYWRCWSVLTGIAISPHYADEWGAYTMSPVSCSC